MTDQFDCAKTFDWDDPVIEVWTQTEYAKNIIHTPAIFINLYAYHFGVMPCLASVNGYRKPNSKNFITYGNLKTTTQVLKNQKNKDHRAKQYS